ncbi:MAG: hypothetical protein PF450_09200, partial [Bacteroidales bacterium]|nr:hypothetical protein [Bacteroidales bacterium]
MNNLFWKYLFVFYLAFCCLKLAHAEHDIQQRYYTSQDGLNISWVHCMTQSADQTIWMGHGAVYTLTSYDGYSFNYTNCPDVILGEVYSDKKGDLWSVNPDKSKNILASKDGKWETFNVEAGIPYLPSPFQMDRLLFLKEGNLLEFDRISNEIQILLDYSETKIGNFLDLALFQDGSIWLSGVKGVLKIGSKQDSLQNKLVWNEYPVPTKLGVQSFMHPFEGINGGIVVRANSWPKKNNALVGFNGTEWEMLYKSNAEDVYAGWPGVDNCLWIIKGKVPEAMNPFRDWDLYHFHNAHEEKIYKNRILNRELTGIITWPDGRFWIATGSGLASFSPTLWKKQDYDQVLNRRFKHMTEDEKGRVWFACESSFVLEENGNWKDYRPDQSIFTSVVTLLNSGQIVVGLSDGGLVLFDPEQESYSMFLPKNGEKFRYYDRSSDGNMI